MYPIEVSKNPKHEPKVWQIVSIQITLVVISLIFMGKAMGSLTKEWFYCTCDKYCTNRGIQI